VGTGVSATYVAALALAALLAGCGGGSESKRSSSKPSTGTATGPRSTSKPSTGTATAPPSADAYWPYAKLVARLGGRTVTVPNATVRLDPALVECSGQGVARQTGSTRDWSRYTCTQTIFRGGVDHDVTFDVVILSATQLRIASPRNGPE
jgi:hypothetical protein